MKARPLFYASLGAILLLGCRSEPVYGPPHRLERIIEQFYEYAAEEPCLYSYHAFYSFAALPVFDASPATMIAIDSYALARRNPRLFIEALRELDKRQQERVMANILWAYDDGYYESNADKPIGELMQGIREKLPRKDPMYSLLDEAERAMREPRAQD
jgi:hypothetical protein